MDAIFCIALSSSHIIPISAEYTLTNYSIIRRQVQIDRKIIFLYSNRYIVFAILI